MTRTVRTSLGYSTLTGKQAVDQTRSFRAQLCSLSKKPLPVALLTVVDTETYACGVVAFYDADDPESAAWVAQAEEQAPELWTKLAERRKGAGRA